MRTATIGSSAYRIVATEERGQWLTHAERVATGDRFGIECAGDSADAAAVRLIRWLEWQYEHQSALETLQQAESAYHRTITGSAFVSTLDEPTATGLQKESLDALEAARTRLDDIRARNPEE